MKFWFSFESNFDYLLILPVYKKSNTHEAKSDRIKDSNPLNVKPKKRYNYSTILFRA